jgi:hypothetical protein
MCLRGCLHRFADSKFNDEIRSGKVTASSLECFTCVALAGICAEYLKFGQAEGGAGDVAQLDVLLKSLNFTQQKTDSEVRCAAFYCVGRLLVGTATLLFRPLPFLCLTAL